MDEHEARHLLGLDNGPVSLSDLREARNGAIKAHHPDKVGSDPAAVRRSTYWTAQINVAYDLLHAQAAAHEHAAAQQRTAAAARAAQQRAAAAAARAAQEQAAAAAARAAQEHAAAQEQADAESGRRSHLRSDRYSTRSATAARLPLVSRRIPAVLVAIAVVGAAAWWYAAGPSLSGPANSPSPVAVQSFLTAPTLPTPSGTASPGASAVFYTWRAIYSAYIAPCYGYSSCNFGTPYTYADGSTYVLEQEIPRLAAVFRDSDLVAYDSTTLCRESRSSLYGLFVGMAVEIELIKSLQPDEIPPAGWAPSSTAQWEDCKSRSTADYQALSEDLRKTTLPQLRQALTKVQQQLRASDWAGAQASSLPLLELATEVAHSSARDYPAGGSTTVWDSMRQLAWDAERLSGEIGIPRLAAMDTTAKLVSSALAQVDGIDTSKPLW